MRRERLCDCILEGDAEKALIETERLLAEGTPPEALLESLAAGMETLGERFQNYDAFLPDLILGPVCYFIQRKQEAIMTQAR